MSQHRLTSLVTFSSLGQFFDRAPNHKEEKTTAHDTLPHGQSSSSNMKRWTEGDWLNHFSIYIINTTLKLNYALRKTLDNFPLFPYPRPILQLHWCWKIGKDWAVSLAFYSNRSSSSMDPKQLTIEIQAMHKTVSEAVLISGHGGLNDSLYYYIWISPLATALSWIALLTLSILAASWTHFESKSRLHAIYQVN